MQFGKVARCRHLSGIPFPVVSGMALLYMTCGPWLQGVFLKPLHLVWTLVKFVLLVWHVNLSLFDLVTLDSVTLIAVRVYLAVKLTLSFSSSVCANSSFYFVYLVYEFCNKHKCIRCACQRRLASNSVIGALWWWFFQPSQPTVWRAQQKLTVVCLLTGADALATVRCFIGENYDWLLSQLGIAPLLSCSDDNSITAPVLSLGQQPQQQQSQYTCRPNEDFNPLNVFTCIGSSPFNHVRTTIDVGIFLWLVIFCLLSAELLVKLSMNIPEFFQNSRH